MSASIATGYTVTNLANDSWALKVSLDKALTQSDPREVRKAWEDTAVNVAKITSGLTELAQTNPSFSGLTGVAANLSQIGLAAYRMSESIQTGGTQNMQASDALAMVGGLADLSGNVLLKPGPTLVAGVVLNGAQRLDQRIWRLVA